MTTLRYTFRPSLFQAERAIVVDDQGIAVHGDDDRRVAWTDVVEVHIEPATAGDDDRTRWLLNLRLRDGTTIRIDSVNVRGTADFEHKTEEWRAIVGAVHHALAERRPPVRFRFGARRGIIVAWRIALVMTAAVGVFGIGAAIVSEEYEAILYAGVFAAFGVVGLMALKGARGPVAYDPVAFTAAWDKPEAADRGGQAS